MKERIIKKGNPNKPMTLILATDEMVAIVNFVILDISTLQQINAQPIFSALQQITKTPETHTSQLPKQKSSASVCNPNDTFVNTTESTICGVPVTIRASNTTTT